VEKGAYIVHVNPAKPDDIQFSNKPETQEVPELQKKLHLEVEKTLMVLRKLFTPGTPEFQDYFNQLLTLAQAGLVPDNAQPSISLSALTQLKNDVIDRKSGEVKNGYFKTLGMKAAWLGTPPLLAEVILLIINFYYPLNDTIQQLIVYANFALAWSAAMLGIWLSFGARKTILSFEELTVIEEDRLEPLMRLIFAGAITVIFCLFFYKKVVVINIGMVSSDAIGTDQGIAMIFGVTLGLSEQILGKKLTKRAAKFFEDF
jgi:hypothetical protein